ncbi:hypothetical protein J3L18_23705 [Mucilaginibacter gossypii]|uniref:hypothetical protein n=1 Tax=Mucilaginibacter gossypii TaxID=551996 RepID=UPI000DCD2E71|nr:MULTISPECIES: hypothetical protein [Mucilaginibacter]QTE36111.1 hypothetical protein J3L18_23705 [Mucilaginibacter gossypii]RAV59975.1 hypothetical protein DIU36_03105 [Mucilaginibacter rubeus]
MNLSEAEDKVYKLVKEIKDALNNSHYEIRESLEIGETGAQVSILDLSTHVGYRDHFLDLGDELVDTLSFLSTSTKFNNNKLIIWVINELNPYTSLIWSVKHIDGSLSSYEELTDPNILNEINLFEEEKKKAQAELISVLKSLLDKKLILNLPQLTWNGSQIQLISLFYKLVERGWLEEPKNSINVVDYAALLDAVFNFEVGEKKGSTNKSENLRRYLQADKKSDVINSGKSFDNIRHRSK